MRLCASSFAVAISTSSFPEIRLKVDIFIAGGKIIKDKTGYLKGERL
ncbi:hypothetical protein vBSflM004_066 [Shigella phage vB_SflM_004]|nr:hypothetical protein vBSflM004_066 [Shigella phage vB_SflM_004]